MKLMSLNCGLPRDFVWYGNTVTTSIVKEPVLGRVNLRRLNLDGDGQSDLTVHGGKDKAVYCYPIEHYEYWKNELPNHPLTMGVFGENFTIEGLNEDSVHIGDRFAVGLAEVVVSQPRMPCYKLALRFRSDDMPKKFLASRRSGFYVSVALEGDVAAGDEITLLNRDPDSASISDSLRFYIAKELIADDILMIRKAIIQEAFPESWKQYFREKISRKALPS